MNRRQVLTAATAAIVAAPAAARAQGGPGAGLVGSWFGTVVATSPPLGQFNDLITFHGDGTVTESRRYLVTPTPIGNLLETTGHGAWKKTGGNRYAAFFRFMLQNADTGEMIGTDNVRMELRVNRTTGAVEGTFVSQIRDTNDALLMEVGGDYSATAITV